MPGLIRHRWRQDRLPLLLFLIAFIVMTYPFVFHMHDSLALHNTDTFEILANNWSLREALIHGRDLNHNQLLFHPRGLDTTLQPQRWTSFPVWTALYSLLGDPFAFNLVSLLGALLKAYGMYLLGLRLYRERIPAWVCGAFYSYSAPILAMTLRTPTVGATEWMPLFMLALMAGLDRVRDRQPSQCVSAIMAIAAFCFAANVYMYMGMGILAMLLGFGYLVWRMIVEKLWAQRRFWGALAVFALTASAISAPLLFRTLRSSLYGFAIDRPVITVKDGNVDMLNYISADLDRPVNYRQVIASLSGDQLEIGCLCRGMSHVGIVALVFAAMGAVYIWRFRRGEAIWILLSILAFLLSLGVIFHFNGEPLNIYWTPYRLLQDNFFFRALWHPFRMIFVFLFPFSILVGYGLHARLRTLRLDRSGWLLLIVSVVMLLYGTSLFPVAMRVSPRPAYLSALAQLPDGAVIDLPMGRHNSKYYMSLQRFHGRPIVEGMLPRTPPDAYSYIATNPLLMRLLHGVEGPSSPDVAGAYWRAAVESLKRDGFRYAILHERVPQSHSNVVSAPQRVVDDFSAWPPIYQDDDNRIFDLWHWQGDVPAFSTGGFARLPDDERLSIAFGDKFTLHSWSLLDSVEARPCQDVTVESWWSIDQTDAVPHDLMLILADSDGDGRLAITEKVPADRFTTEWRTGVYYRDQTAITIPCATADGNYPLLLGMKESMSGASLPIQPADGSAAGSLLYLTTLKVGGD